MVAVLCLLAGILALPAAAEEKPSKADVFEAVEGISAITENYTAPAYMYGCNGVLVQTNAISASFRYKGAIDARLLTQGESFFSFYALGGENSAIITELVIRLIDTQNEDNWVGLRYTPVSVNNNTSYALAYSNGRWRGLGDDGITLIEDTYGTGIYGASFYPEASNSVVPFDSRFDYASRSFYNYMSSSGTKLILNMADESLVGEGGGWNGFAKDECYLEVEMSLTSATAGGIVVQTLFGENMSGPMGDSAPDPQITVDYPGTELPMGAVGVEYPLPQASAFDWYHGKQPVDIALFKEAEDITASLEGASFVPESTGSYSVTYKAENSFGGSDSASLVFTVKQSLPQYSFYFKGGLKSAELGKFFFVPEISVSGGSGALNVSEDVRYNGKNVELGTERRFFVSEPGMIELKYTVSGYCGEPYTRIFGIPVENPAAKIILSGYPRYIKSGVPLMLPACSAEGSAVSGAELIITADGQPVTGGSVTTQKAAGETVQVVWTLQKGSEVLAAESLDLAVIDPQSAADYPQTLSGSPVFAAGSRGVEISASSDYSFAMPFPVALNQAAVTFSFAGSADYIDVLFEDEIYPEISAFLRIARSATGLTVQLNGTGVVQTIDGDFTGNSNISLLLDRSGIVSDSRGNTLFQARLCESGVCRVSVSVAGVQEDTLLTLIQVGNQRLTGSDQAPDLLTGQAMPTFRYAEFGEIFYVYTASAYDVYDYGGDITLRVTAPDSTVLYEGKPADMSFSASQYGLYFVDYLLTDTSGKTATRRFLISVLDREAPQIVLSGVPSKAEVGKKINLPVPQISDNLDDACGGYIVVRNTKTYISEMVYMAAAGQWAEYSHTFEAAGDYEILYVVSDTAGNTAVASARIRVE